MLFDPQTTTTDKEVLIGVISDTHGRLSPKVLEIFQDVSLILHAGDIDHPDILRKLAEIATVKAVRGNTDYHAGLRTLPTTEAIQVGETFIYMLHDLQDLEISPQAAGFHVVIHGHLHVPENQPRGEVLFLNPGSPTSPRRGSAAGVALLHVNGSTARADLIPLD